MATDDTAIFRLEHDEPIDAERRYRGFSLAAPASGAARPSRDCPGHEGRLRTHADRIAAELRRLKRLRFAPSAADRHEADRAGSRRRYRKAKRRKAS